MNLYELEQMINIAIEKYDIYSVMLYNQKVDFEGNITSFKICIVINSGIARSIERTIYADLESPVPFDVLVYTKTEWLKILNREHSFAAQINKKGYIIYGQKN